MTSRFLYLIVCPVNFCVLPTCIQLTVALTLALEERQYEDGPPMELLQPHTLEYIVLQIMPVFKNRFITLNPLLLIS